MNDKIEYFGKIIFDPVDKTKKHKSQSNWKRVAFVEFDGDICEYYAWFIQKRYNLILNKPIRKAHISFINDSITDLSQSGSTSINDVDKRWNLAKAKWNGKEISCMLDISPKTDDYYWWLTVPNEDRDLLHGIRAELGLGRPYWGLHMSIGYANPKHEEHSKYIHNLIKKGLITT